MDRLACVNVPALPLQILLRAHPDWRGHPVVVVDRDKPLGIIQWVNTQARASRILPGMRYATGLSLSRTLRGGVVSEAEIDAATDLLTQRLWSFSPRIEAPPEEPGILWLDAAGLRRLYPMLEHWASLIREDLRALKFEAVVAVGFSRFGTRIAAKTHRKNVVYDHPDAERAHLCTVAIERLDLEPGLRDTLQKLGIKTLGDFAALPPQGIRKRFGPEAHALYTMAQREQWEFFTPRPLLEPAQRTTLLEYPETNTARLLVHIEPLLHAVLAELRRRHEALAALRLSLQLDDRSTRDEELSPAEPTCDAEQLLSLVRLRLETVSLSAGAIEIRVLGRGVPVSEAQLELFRAAPRKNLDAAHAAFAKVRAELGGNAIVYARLHEGHLPEARFTWEPMKKLRVPECSGADVPSLVRRVCSPPIPLPSRARREPDGWLIARLEDGPVEEVIGPHVVSGGWWRRGVAREYYYVRTRSGRWLWIYYDRLRRRWYLQGEVQ